MAHTNHVRTIRLTPEQIENQRQRARRARLLANQPWHLDGLTLTTAFTPLPEDALAPLTTRFTAHQQKVYDARAAIIEKLRKGTKSMDAAEREDDLPDDRITCHTCRNWQLGYCGALKYRVVVRAMRCQHYLPNAHDPNKQTGLERWPHLIVKGS